ncbi:AP endonuclease [Clostridium perfringens]|nr:AP endonuclease [Clostridium perfringens]
MKLNGVELDLDLMDLDISEKFDKETEKVVAEAERAKGKNRSESIKIQCYAVFNCIDNLFGKGTHKKIFGDKVNLRDCLRVFEQLILEMKKQDEEDAKEFSQMASKYSPNRVQRRFNKNKKNKRK